MWCITHGGEPLCNAKIENMGKLMTLQKLFNRKLICESDNHFLIARELCCLMKCFPGESFEIRPGMCANDRHNKRSWAIMTGTAENNAFTEQIEIKSRGHSINNLLDHVKKIVASNPGHKIQIVPISRRS